MYNDKLDVSKAPLSPEAIAHDLGGAEQTGPVTWRCFCPCCGYRKPFAIYLEDDGTLGVVCYCCGPEGREAIWNELHGRGYLSGDYDPTLARSKLLASAATVWANSFPIAPENLATIYLASRGLNPPFPDTIRVNALVDKNGIDIPGPWLGRPPEIASEIVCLAEHVRRGILGVHTIRLWSFGERKAHSPHRYRRRGNLDGGGVWFGRPGGELVVGDPVIAK